MQASGKLGQNCYVCLLTKFSIDMPWLPSFWSEITQIQTWHTFASGYVLCAKYPYN